MRVLREECISGNLYAITLEDDVICFNFIERRSQLLIYYSITDFNDKYLINFSAESFEFAINNIDIEFYSEFIDTIINCYYDNSPIDEGFIVSQKLFAVGFDLTDMDDTYTNLQSGYRLAEENDFYSIRIKRNYIETKYVFHKRFFNHFFSTEISSDYTIAILQKIPDDELFYKIIDYYVKGKYNSLDSLEISKVLKPVSRKDKIASYFKGAKK